MPRNANRSILELRPILAVIAVALAFMLGAEPVLAWTDVDRPYRNAGPESDACKALKDNPTALQKSGNKEEEEAWWTCALQHHSNQPASGGAANTSVAKKEIHDPGAYYLGFVEFGEDGRELESAQRTGLFNHLRTQAQNYVVVYVHGWRHDARFNDEDIRSFRTLLSYTKNALEHRCVEAQRYCGATLTGVYIGWRGQVLSDDGDGYLSAAIAAPTFFSRKPTSEAVGVGVARFLKDMSGLLDARGASTRNIFERDHMLSIGHSLGGNVLISGLGPDITSSISSQAAGKPMRPPAGDLIVLLNPAAEATKWTAIQDAVSQRGPGFIAPGQLPLLVSLTVACHYTEAELQDPDLNLRTIACDTVTGTIFPIYQILNFNFSEESRTALGHLDPDGDGNTRAGHGTTHEFDINGSLYTHSDYSRAADANYSECRIADGWMTNSKQRAPGRERWDAGYKWNVDVNDPKFGVDPINDAVRLNLSEEKLKKTYTKEEIADLRVMGQFRHGIYRGDGPSITGADDPFWNVRAIDSVARDHTKIFSPLTWCALHQLVLDDVAGPPFPKEKIWKKNPVVGGAQKKNSP